MIKHNVEQNSPEWDLLRGLGIPTSSNFKLIITSNGEPSKSLDGYAETLAGALYAGKPLDLWEGNKYTDYGHDTEEEAAAWYQFKYDKEVSKVGFITDDNGQHILKDKGWEHFRGRADENSTNAIEGEI